jgi:hypothetical protein
MSRPNTETNFSLLKFLVICCLLCYLIIIFQLQTLHNVKLDEKMIKLMSSWIHYHGIAWWDWEKYENLRILIIPSSKQDSTVPVKYKLKV